MVPKNKFETEGYRVRSRASLSARSKRIARPLGIRLLAPTRKGHMVPISDPAATQETWEAATPSRTHRAAASVRAAAVS